MSHAGFDAEWFLPTIGFTRRSDLEIRTNVRCLQVDGVKVMNSPASGATNQVTLNEGKFAGTGLPRLQGASDRAALLEAGTRGIEWHGDRRPI